MANLQPKPCDCAGFRVLERGIYGLGLYVYIYIYTRDTRVQGSLFGFRAHEGVGFEFRVWGVGSTV